MFDKMKQLMDFKRQADQIKRELDSLTVVVNEGRGIQIAMTGSQEFRSVGIDEQLLSPARKTELERELLNSLNAVVKKAQQTAAQKMSAVMPQLPGMV